MNIISRLVLRRAGLLFTIGFILSVICTHYSILLYINLRPDIEELLPTSSRSVIDLYEVTDRLESTDNLAVLVFSENTEQSKKFVIGLAERLEKFDRDVVAGVEYRIDKELEYFKKRRALYMELEDLISIRSYIQDRIEYEKQLYNPLTIFRTTEIPEPKLDFVAIENKYGQKVSSYSKFPDGFYATPDEKIRTVLVHLPGKISGVEGAHRLRDAVDQAIEEVNPAAYSDDIRIAFTGGVQDLIEEHASLIADLELSTIIVIVLVTGAMILFYKSVRGTMAILISLLMGTLWCFGISYFLVGYLNANSAFLGAIVIGNGINFGIIFLARYLEERRKKSGHIRAIHYSMTKTWKATWIAALAAALAYGSLALTAFRGFRQFGIIGLIGMVLCWVSAFTMLPALLTLFEKWKPIKPKGEKKRPGWFSASSSYVIRTYPKALTGVMASLTVIAGVAYLTYGGEIFETDLSKLRDKKSNEEGSGYHSHYLHQIFQGYPHPLVVLAKNREEAGRISEGLKQQKASNPKETMIASVRSLDDFLPKEQPKKIQALQEIKNLISPKIFSELSGEDKRRVKELLSRDAMELIDADNLPPLVKSKLTEKSGAIGNLVLVEPPVDGRTEDVTNLTGFIREIRDVADEVREGTPVAGTLAISADMIDAIRRDGPRATLFAFLAVVVLVVILFRNVRMIATVLTSLILGVSWLAGMIFYYDLKINFLNFIALPITFGIGVDYAVNIFQRYQLEGPGSMSKVIRHTGGAVGLASLTTIIGYGSLLIAGNQAFVSFGTLAVLGELTCGASAIILMPALVYMIDRRAEKKSSEIDGPPSGASGANVFAKATGDPFDESDSPRQKKEARVFIPPDDETFGPDRRI